MPLQDFVEPPPQTVLPGEHAGLLGRILAVDSRDYDARALFAAAAVPIPTLDQRVWFPPRAPLDQGQTSSCTAHALAHRFLGAPDEHRNGQLPFDPLTHYAYSQSIDEWPGGEELPARLSGEPYYQGTSVRAALEAARTGYTTSDGKWIAPFIHSYWALKTFDDLLAYLLSSSYVLGGSPVMGTNWSRGMFQVDDGGYLVYDAARVSGGHAWLTYAGNRSRDTADAQNSWGSDPLRSGMGRKGRFRLKLLGSTGLEAMYKDDGEAWAVVEQGTPAVAIAARAIEQGGLT